MTNKQDLIDSGCWFDGDKAGGVKMTAFKREARWRQHRWAVDERSIATFGTHPGRRIHADVPPEDVANGTKLQDQDAEAGENFLNAAIHQVARDRVALKQPHETLDHKRLFRDLLSSMPMAFNLFGEASLSANAVSRDRLGLLFGISNAGVSSIVFEWSPGRRSDKYTRDRTAFDVALIMSEPDEPATAIGIETKYHEHSAPETKPSAAKPEALARFQGQTDFLVELAESSGVFKRGWKDQVLRTDLRQIWRDHLLALSMRRHSDEWSNQCRYVLVHPGRNISFADAARRYADLLEQGDSSFQAHTVEAVVDAAFAHGGGTREAFRRRYLW
jgi:hypothetical protein